MPKLPSYKNHSIDSQVNSICWQLWRLVVKVVNFCTVLYKSSDNYYIFSDSNFNLINGKIAKIGKIMMVMLYIK